MIRRLTIVIVGVLALVLAACGSIAPGGGDPTQVADPQSAAAFLPTLDGYTVTGANNISDAIAAAAGEGAEQFGNPMIEQVITRIDSFIQCYQDVGAVSANIYTQTDLTQTLTEGTVPAAGAVAVVNQDRVRENLLSCISGGGGGAFSAQSVTTCQGSGSFESGGDTFTYVYVGTQESFCTSVQSHFGGF